MTEPRSREILDEFTAYVADLKARADRAKPRRITREQIRELAERLRGYEGIGLIGDPADDDWETPCPPASTTPAR